MGKQTGNGPEPIAEGGDTIADDSKTAQTVSPVTQTQDWEASYKGLQRTTTKKINDLEATISSQRAQIEQLTEQIEATKLEKTTTEKKADEVQKQVTGLQETQTTNQTRISELEAQIQRANLILKEFPHLSEFETVLPSGDDMDKLREKFTVFSDTISKKTAKTAAQMIEGAVPAGSGKTNLSGKPEGDYTPDYAYEQMIRNAGVNQEEYQKWQKIYDDLTAEPTN